MIWPSKGGNGLIDIIKMIKKYIIYKHLFPNNKVYIGYTSTTVEQRWQNGQNYKNQPLVWRAICKYKWENISHEILFETENKELAENKEREFITEIYHSNNPKFGYNIDNGGLHSGRVSTKTKNKMSKSNKGKIPWNKDKHNIYSKETLNKIATTAKNNINNTGRFKKGHSGFGPTKYKKIQCVETNEIFNSVKEIKQKYTKYNTDKIYLSIKTGKPHFGFHWKNITYKE